MRNLQRYVLKDAVDLGSKLVGRRDAVYVMQDVTGYKYEDIMIRGDATICNKFFAEFEQKIKRLVGGEPLQYVLGKWDFCGIEFNVDERALIPRPETELLVEAVIDHIKDKHRLDILDVCTGSGCVGLAIAKLTDFSHNVLLADISEDALSLALENSVKHGANVNFIRSDLLATIPGKLDVIVSNPPYIPGPEMKSLPKNIIKYEPHLALNGGTDGLDIYKKLIPQSFKSLKPGGMIFLEIGPTQTYEILHEFGFSDIKIQKDYAGIDRILQGVKKHV